MTASVLLVADVRDEREMYAEYLHHLGHRTFEAADAVEAFRVAVTEHPDIVITDATLRGESGFRLTEHLKADERTRDVPVIILSGRVFNLDSDQAARVHCDAFLTKPCLPKALALQIVDVLSRSRHLRREAAKCRRRAVQARLRSRAVNERSRRLR